MISPAKAISYMTPGLVRPYDFNDQGWADPTDPRYNDKFRYLAERVCAVGEKYYIRNPRGEWEDLSNKSHAVTRTFQEHGGAVSIAGAARIIGIDDVKAFFGLGIIHFRATTYAPLAGAFVWFNGERRLNLYCDRRIDGETADIPACEEFLRVIRNSLCAEPDELDLPAMLEEIGSDHPSPFRWVIHWLAARYQRPGWISQTNLWFIGGRGTGKGSLLKVMRRIMGPRSVGKVESSDIERGWSTSLFASDLLEWDEFASIGWRDLNRFLKEKTGNETVAVAQRNVGDVLHPNVTQHIFSTNDLVPMYIEADDRQNTFIKTADSAEWKARAKALWSDDNDIVDPRIVTGFAALLNTVDVDIAFIRSPLKTELRASLVDHFADDSVAMWLADYGGEHDQPSWEDLHASYRAYVQTHCSGKPKDLKAFKAAMKEGGHAKETVGKTKDRKSVRYLRLVGRDD